MSGERNDYTSRESAIGSGYAPQSQSRYDSYGQANTGSYGSSYGSANTYPGSPYRSGRPISSSYDIFDAPGSAYGPKNGSERCIPKCFAEKGNRVSRIIG